jgi:type I restriction enzyme S subunit
VKFKPYPKYRASGVEWLGDVPEGWEISALKYVVSMQSGGQITSENIAPIGDYPVFGGNGLRGYTSTFTHDGFYVLIGRQGALCGNVNYAAGKFWASEHAVVVSPIGECSTVWLGELLRTMNLGQYSITAAQPGLSVEAICKLRIPLPPPTEQSAIAAFLDRETAKIDTLIAKQEKLINLLKEKRQAVISHAVTKGLDSTVRMKPSGVEWLGDVPEHWELSPIKHLALMASGGTPSKDRPEFWNGPHPWASAKDLKVEVLYDTEDHITDEAIEEGRSTLVPPDSVLIVVRGMILLHTLPVTMNAVPMAINQDLKALRTLPKCIPKYLAVLLRGLNKEILGRTDQAAHGTKALRMSDWTGMLVPLPSIPEQHAVVERIESQTIKIDTLIAKAQQAIALQKEHRTALISAAVTGKINVRDAVLKINRQNPKPKIREALDATI